MIQILKCLFEVISLRLNGVLNPNRKGGSGNFKVSSMLGAMILDENSTFASIGIGEKVTLFPFAMVEIVNNSAG